MARFRLHPCLAAALLAAGPAFAAAPAPAAAPASPAAPTIVHHYQRLIFAESLAALKDFKPGPEAGTIAVHGVAVLQTKEFVDAFRPYLGRPMTTQSVKQLAQDVSDYVKKHDRLVVNILIPNQDISAGDFRMAVVIGRYSELKIKGNRYFSDRLLESKLGVKPGDEVRLSALESAVAWANGNPFRHVEVLVNTVNKQPGIADLDVAVMEHFPVRFSFMYDDSGNNVIGNNHYTGSVQFGNLWGLDQQASYQYTTTDDIKIYQAHSFDYRIPLPWRHYLVFDAAYAQVQPLLNFDGVFIQLHGVNYVGDVHYIIPFQLGAWKFESSTGLDYKQINNNFLYGGIPVETSTIDVAQFTESLSGGRPDRLGATAFALNLNYSPGDFNSRNTDAAFAAAHNGNDLYPARYAYGTLVLQRRFDLPLGVQAFTKAIGQVSSADLVSSEEMTIGGQATVRGYNELLFSGDQGVVLSEELQAPPVHLHPGFLGKKTAPLVARPLVFLDYARVYYKHLDNTFLPPLMSAGVGLRANLASNVGLSFDFGWQILQTQYPPQPNHCRGHVKVSFAF